jgi:nitrogen fixation protein NifU and related proteins
MTDLYGSVIRDRFRHPRFHGRVERPDAVFEDVNPLCGDRIAIECRLDDGRIAEARHHGDCCAICAASADLLLEMAHGRAIADAAALGVPEILERVEADIRPSRMKCVALPVTVLQGALAGREAAR